MSNRYELYLMLAIPLIWYITFKYFPIYGVQIAFKEFSVTKGIWGSDWIGLKYFNRFFSSYYFWEIMWNTVSLSLYSLLAGFPIPIGLALLINEIQNKSFKKWVQNVTYIPHFLSVVVIVGMIKIFFDPNNGIINSVRGLLGFESIHFLQKASWFQTIFVSSDVWQHMGWSSIIYIAALSAVDPTLYEAARMDGASRFKRIIHVSIPGIMPTIIILFILQMGHMMDAGFEKVLLMQNPLNTEKSEIIGTYVYRMGIQGGEFSFTAAVGLFNSVIDFTLLLMINSFARRKTESSLW